MAVVDEYGATLPKAGAAVPVPTMPAPATTSSDWTPTTSPGSVGVVANTTSKVPSSAEFSTLVQGTPEYKAAMEGIDLYRQQQQSTIDFNALQQTQQNQLAQQQLGAYDPIYAAQDAMRQEQAAQQLAYTQGAAGLQAQTAAQQLQAQRAAAALQLDTAQHTLSTQKQLDAIQQSANERAYAQQQKYVREALGSRGNAGGQLGFELGNLQAAWDTAQQQRALSNEDNQFTFDQFVRAQGLDAANAQFSYDQFVRQQGLDAGNAQFAYDLLLRDIALEQQQRQVGRTLEQQKLDLSNQQIAATKTYQQGNLALDIAQRKGEALLQVESQLVQWWWDPATGVYRGPGAATMTVAQAAATLPDVNLLPGPVQDEWTKAQQTAIAAGDQTFYMPSPGNVQLDTGAVPSTTTTSDPAWLRQLAATSAALNKKYGLG